MWEHDIFSVGMEVDQKFRRPHVKWQVKSWDEMTDSSVVVFGLKWFSYFLFLVFIFNLFIVFDFTIGITIIHLIDSRSAPLFLFIIFGCSHEFFVVLILVYSSFGLNLACASKLIKAFESRQAFLFFFLFFLVKFENIWTNRYLGFFAINFLFHFVFFQFLQVSKTCAVLLCEFLISGYVSDFSLKFLRSILDRRSWKEQSV